jgi:GNAT superfamily N-acetyltransferase
MSAGPASRPDVAVPVAGPEVRPVVGRADLGAFIRLPHRLHAADPLWVPPLDRDVRGVLDPGHPFHAHADVQCFLARRAGTVVGRIVAVVNRAYCEFHGERTGTFGLFEAEDDPAVATALLAAAESWLRGRGMTKVMGPFNLSTNDELWSPGFLVDGFHRPPVVMMGHSPPYYATLVETAGYTKAKDLIAYWIADGTPPARLVQGVEKLARRQGIVIRPLDMRNLNADVDRIQAVYNSAWGRNWGFVPMSEAEIRHLARQLKPVVKPELCAIAEVEGEPVGFALALPDYNQVLRRMGGRLFPTGLLRMLWYRRSIDAARVLTLGVRPGYRHKGLDALLILHLYREGVAAGYPRGECSWILEDNWDMRRGLERIGAVADKTYRVYERPLAGTAA